MNINLDNFLEGVDVSNSQLADALIRSNLSSFIQKAFTTLNPGDAFRDNWHIHAIAWVLEEVRAGRIKRLIINMPPRSMKTISASVAFPAFIHGHDPTKKIISVTYSQELSAKMQNDYRAIIESHWYHRLFPDVIIDPRKDSEREVCLTKRGYRLATSVGGTLTGRGGDTIIIDDPIKAADAMSEAIRDKVWEWYGGTLLSRLDDKNNGAIVIVGQRVHANDLVGNILETTPDGWTILNLPAIAIEDQIITLGSGREFHRSGGDVLHPERESAQILEELRQSMGSAAFEAQYQQTPVPPGGAMFKRDWLRYYTELPIIEPGDYIIQSWDTASKVGLANDWSVCVTFLFKHGRYYLLDVYRKKLNYPELREAAIRLQNRYNPWVVLVEDANVGTGLIEELRRESINVVGIVPVRSKETRASIETIKFESGRVLFPKKAPWLPALEAELLAFPGSRHDDQVDAIVQVLAYEFIGHGTVHRSRIWPR